MSHPLPNLMSTSVDKIKEMVDSSTIIGDPIVTPEGVTIIPVSKVNIGYAGGGSDFMTKNYPVNKPNAFGGGSGAAVTLTPVAFLVIKGDNVRLLPVAEPAASSLERLIEKLPDLIDQVSALLKKKGADNAEK